MFGRQNTTSNTVNERQRTALSADNTRPRYSDVEIPSNSLLGGYFPNTNQNSAPAPQYQTGAIVLPFSPPNPPQPPNPPPVLPNSAPAPAPSPVPTPSPTPTSTPVLEPGPINIYSSTQQQIADYYTAWENWQNWVKSQSSSAPATTALPNSVPAPATTVLPNSAPAPASATQSPSRKVDPNLNSQQQAALDELWVNNYQGWSEARQIQHMNLLYSMWGKTVPTSFTITTTPAPPPASNQYSISNQIQQGMNALMQGEELPPFSQPPQPQGPNIFDSNSNAFSGILQQLTDISNSNWRETYDPYGQNPSPLPNSTPTELETIPTAPNYTLIIGAGVGALVLVYFYTKK